MPIRAVIFDLFGTLVPEVPRDDFYGSVDHMARVLGADPGKFRDAWNATAFARQTAGYASMEENLLSMCELVGLPRPNPTDVSEALRGRDEMYERWFYPREGAIETLGALRSRGFPLGLISMCGPGTPEMWRASRLAGLVDVEVFSSEVGLRKPDPAIYLYACERLDVDPPDCLYCGDGSYRELTGATELGMTAVEIRDPNVDITTLLNAEPDDWAGARVADLRELLTMV